METPVLPSDMPEGNVNDEQAQEHKQGEEPNINEDASQAGSVETGTDEAGFDTSTYEQEFLENGSLSEESYNALAKKGISREIVDKYIEGRKAYVENYDKEIMNACGGEAEYKAMAAWAGENLTEAEIESYNKAVNSKDTALARLATGGLYARYKAAVAQVGASDVNFVEGKSATGNASVYKNTSEIVRDKKDPRYECDAVYRKSVDEKIRRSINAGEI